MFVLFSQLTTKLLRSLVNCVPIVTPSFWKSYVEWAENHKTELPNLVDFLPDVDTKTMGEDATKEILLPNAARKNLFQNITFIFVLQEHMKRLEEIITLAGGVCLVKCGQSQTMILTTKSVAIACAERFQSNLDSKTKKAFENDANSNNIQIIHEQEIIISILKAKTENLFKRPNRIQASLTSFFNKATKSPNAILDGSIVDDEKMTHNHRRLSRRLNDLNQSENQ